MAEAVFNKNGDGHDTPTLDEEVMKILVVGEQRCGKSSFIRTFARDNFAAPTYTDNGTTVYQYSYYHNAQLRRYAFVEIPGVLAQQLHVATANHLDSKSCIFVFAIDDPSSLQQLKDKWIPSMNYMITFLRMPTMAVGFKADLRESQQVIDRLASANLAPVTAEEGQSLTALPQIKGYFECSHNDLPSVNDAFNFILTKTYEAANA